MAELEAKAHELEGELLVENERHDTARAEVKRARQHARDVS